MPISDSLEDPLGIHMTIIFDEIQNEGWQPNGYEKRNGYRMYKYKAFDSKKVLLMKKNKNDIEIDMTRLQYANVAAHAVIAMIVFVIIILLIW